MIEILKKYKLAEITKRVNKRILTYDFDFGRVIYTYCGINKEEFKLTYEKWGKIMKKYIKWEKGERTIEIYEEIRND
jgi:hypothetical protein